MGIAKELRQQSATSLCQAAFISRNDPPLSHWQLSRDRSQSPWKRVGSLVTWGHLDACVLPWPQPSPLATEVSSTMLVFFLFFMTELLCVALAILEFTPLTRLALNSDPPASASLVHHHAHMSSSSPSCLSHLTSLGGLLLGGTV